MMRVVVFLLCLFVFVPSVVAEEKVAPMAEEQTEEEFQLLHEERKEFHEEEEARLERKKEEAREKCENDENPSLCLQNFLEKYESDRLRDHVDIPDETPAEIREHKEEMHEEYLRSKEMYEEFKKEREERNEGKNITLKETVGED